MNSQQILSLILLLAQVHPATLLASAGTIASPAQSPARVRLFRVRGQVSVPRAVSESHTPVVGVALARPSAPLGQSSTLLPDGSTLVIGGETAENWSGKAEIRSADGAVVPLRAHLRTPRAFHTATLLPSGKVLVFGGLNADGLVAEPEVFDPEARQFAPYTTKLTPRAHHTATVLSDGRVAYLGGVDENDVFIDKVELWDDRTASLETLNIGLTYQRKDALATLQQDGRVRIHGGVNSASPSVDEIFDPAAKSFELAPEVDNDANAVPPSIAASIPAADATGVHSDVQMSLRFSALADVRSIEPKNFSLKPASGPEVSVKVVPTENGRLVFLSPRAPLSSGTAYTLKVDGPRTLRGDAFASYEINFTTEKAPGPMDSRTNANDPNSQPTSANRTRAPQEDNDPEPLQAPAGVTALSGITKTIFGKYLANVTFTLDCDGKKASGVSDTQGRFLLTSQSSGHCELEIDGTTAHDSERDFGRFFPGVDLAAGQTNVLPYTVWMTPIDHAHEITIPSPTTGEVVITHPNLKGLELHLPPRTVIRDYNGQVVTKLGITPIPIRRPPFPLPQGVPVPIYFTIQPGGSFVEVGGSRYGTGKGAQLIYPNTHRAPAGMPFDFWDYDPDGRGWYVYGKGHVSKNRRSVVPDPGVVIHRFTGAMVADPGTAPPMGPPPPPCIHLFGFSFCLPGAGSGGGNGAGGNGGGGPGAGDPNGSGPNGKPGDPVDPSTGLFVYELVDYVLPDVIPFTLRRTYRQGDPLSRSFGIGTSSDTDIFLMGDTNPWTYQDLILPEGSRVHFTRVSQGTSWSDAVYQTQGHSGAFFGSSIAWNGNGWSLTLRNGTVWSFPEAYLQTNAAKAGIQSIQDRYGNQISLTRDPNTGGVTRVTTQNGRFLAFSLDTNGRVLQAQDNLGRTTKYQYDQGGRLVQVTNPAGGITQYTYDANDQMLTITDPRGNSMLTNVYDAEGRVQKQVLADGSFFTFAYAEDANGNIIQTDVTNPRGNIRRMFFNQSGYFSGGQMTSEIHAVGKSEQQSRTYSWDPSTGLLQSATDPMNRTVSYFYDANGNVSRTTWLAGTPDATSVSVTYDPALNKPLTVTDALNRTTQFTYDSLGNLTKTTTPAGIVWNRAYNASGQLLSVSNTAAGTLQFEYLAGLLGGVRDNAGNHSSTAFDPIGRRLQRVDALGNTTTFQYDSGNRVNKTVDALGGVTQFAWDANTNLLSLTDANGNVTAFEYDNRDHQITRTDPLQNRTHAIYNPNGNMGLVTDRKGQSTQVTYDALDRVTQIRYADNSTTTFTYDSGDRVVQIADSTAGNITRTYDNMDRLLSETTPQGTVSYAYDKAGERTSMTAGNQTVVTYSYDADGRLLQILQGVNTVGFAYDNAGRRSSMTLPGAITATYSYDSASRLASLVYSQATTSLGNLTYAYDANGNIIAKGGTLAGTVLPASVMSATYNAANELVHRDGNTFIYDANGNLLTDGGSTYTWDARNQLSTLAGPSMSSVFQYDGLGRRQAKAINSVQTNYLFDGANTVQEQGVDGSVVANVLTGLGVDQTLVRSDASGTNAFLVDALGSTLELVDGSGNLSSQCSYDPFGVSAASGPSSNTVQYAGRENDGTGLYYYRARYYNPKLGRFISEDPIGFSSGQTNLHAYVNDSPVNANDPSGLITGNVGVGGSGTFWGVSGNVFGGVVVDGYGNVGLYWGWGAGTGVGSGFSGGAQMGASTGTTIDDFGGPFYDAGLEGGVGSGYATDVYTGQGSDGSVVNGFTGTVGWGFGAGGWAGVTNTNIIPLGHLPFPQPSQPRPK